MVSVENEFQNAPIRDKRLRQRLSKIAATVVTEPAATFPKMAASDSELEAIYRFLNNPRVTPQAILEPHRLATDARAAEFSSVIAVHDTTEFAHDGEAAEELGYLATGQRGFFGHFSLLLGEQFQPLGIAAMRLRFRNHPPRQKGPKRKALSGFYTAKKKDRERECWLDGVRAVEDSLPKHTKALHVMDRGADGYELFSELAAQKSRFVIRIRQMPDRVATASENATEWDDLGTVVAGAKYFCKRQVTLSRRRAKRAPETRYAPRKQRAATLNIEASPLILRRSAQLPAIYFPPELALSLVRVREVDVPPGEEAVDWWLVTNEPIGDQAAVEAIVDAYRARWKIEEFFKALKTGCGWRERQLETRKGLVNTLALLIPIAWHLLAIRDMVATSPTALATTQFSARQLRILREMSKRPLPDDATVEQAMYAVAGQGGHLMRNGRPGWQTLGRGLEKLWWASYGYGIAMGDHRRAS